MKNLLVALPCYNEAENIEALVDNWLNEKTALRAEDFQLTVLIIDDKSNDDTNAIAAELMKAHNEVQIITHETNLGLSGGLNTALHYYHDHFSQDDVLCIMDGDNTHLPKYVHSMLARLAEGNDCMIASRYCQASDTVGVQKHRVFMSDMARYYYKVMLKVPNVEDYTCGYRVYTYDLISNVLTKYGEDPVKEKSFACMMELLYKAYLVGGKFAEVPFQLRYDNKGGNSKMNVIRTAYKSLTTAVVLRFSKGKK